MKENHIRFDKAYATERQRLQAAFDLHDQASLLWQEAKEKYQADTSKWRIARRQWEYRTAKADWDAGNTHIFPVSLTTEDFRLLEKWLDRENTLDHPSKASPWDVGVIHPDEPNVMSLTTWSDSGSMYECCSRAVPL